ncbi:hypothetical protein D3C80_1590950 [compost metagenome]
MAQLVRMDVAVQPLLNAPLGETFLYVARRNSLPKLREKQRIFLCAKQPTQIQPVFNPDHRVAANRQASLFAAFAHHPHFAGIQIEVFQI